MVNTKTKFPRGILDQAISFNSDSTESQGVRLVRASSDKQQATKPQASSGKH